MNNTMNHVSDQASTVKFNPAGTQWPATITDVQSALAKIGSWANLDNGLPPATLNTAGVIKTCTLAEVEAGTVDDKAVTPKVLKEFQTKPRASKDAYGTTRYATNTELDKLDSNDISISAAGMNYILESRPATEGRAGALRIATTAQAEAASQDNVLMTPKKVLACINAHRGAAPPTATESIQGLVELATTAEIQAGTAREGFAISPYGFANTRATNSTYGTFKLATDSEMTNLNVENSAVTPAALGRNKGTIGKFGVVALSASAANTPNTALASTAPVIYSNVANQVMHHHLYVGAHAESNRVALIQDLTSATPVGSIMMWPMDADPPGYCRLDGRWLPKASYPVLFSILGYHYGGNGVDHFAIPDMRGMFPRGTDHGRGYDAGRGTGTAQRCGVEYHKHYSGWGEHPNSHGSYFGRNPRIGYGGSKSTDWDNSLFFTNEGAAFEGADPNAERPGVMANETRPWNVALNFIIKLG